MLTNQQLESKIQQLQKEKKSVTWAVIDASCHLSLRVVPQTQTAAFYFRTRQPKQISRLLGLVTDISLTEARQKAFTLQVCLEKGEDFPESRTIKKNILSPSPSLAEILFAWRDAEMKKAVPRWNPNDRKAKVKFDGIIKNHLEPAFRKCPIEKISAEDLEAFLTDLFKAHSSFATSLRAWIRGALMFAERQGLCKDGYAKVHRLELLLKDARWRHQGPRTHHASLPVSDLPEFMAELREIGGTTARCLEVAILTCSRVNSVTQMKWEDIDFKNAIWRCPMDTMKVKSNGDHIVYLAPHTLQILASMPRVLPRGKKAIWVFSTARGERICNSLTKTILSINARRTKRGLSPWIDPEQSRLAGKPLPPTPHGFRATFKSWTRNERLGNWQRFDQVAVERCMHHFVKDQYEGAYDREDFPLLQRTILEEWAQYCYSHLPLMPTY